MLLFWAMCQVLAQSGAITTIDFSVATSCGTGAKPFAGMPASHIWGGYCSGPTADACVNSITPPFSMWNTSHGQPVLLDDPTDGRVLEMQVGAEPGVARSQGFYYNIPLAVQEAIKGRQVKIAIELKIPDGQAPFSIINCNLIRSDVKLECTGGDFSNYPLYSTVPVLSNGSGFNSASFIVPIVPTVEALFNVDPMQAPGIQGINYVNSWRTAFVYSPCIPQINYSKLWISARGNLGGASGNSSGTQKFRIRKITITYINSSNEINLTANPANGFCYGGLQTATLSAPLVPPNLDPTANGNANTPTNVDYRWSGTSATTNPINVNLVNTSTYTVTATSLNTCAATKSITVTVQPPVVATITPSIAACATNLAASVNNTANNNTYRWSTGATTSSITTTVAATYTVTATTAAGCTGTASYTTTSNFPTAAITGNPVVCNTTSTAVITATGGGTYMWNTGQTVPIIAAAVGTYTVTVAAPNTCTATASITVRIVPMTVAIAASPATITAAQPAVLTATASYLPATYVWNTGAAGATISVTVHGTYTVTATNASGCTASTTIYVEQASCANLPGYTLIGRSGDSTLITNLVGVGLPISPVWNTPNIISIAIDPSPDGPTVMRWLIRGKLIFNKDIYMPNLDFRMCEDASIQIGFYAPDGLSQNWVPVGREVYLSGGEQLDDNTIQGIDRMWEGITVLSPSRLDIRTAFTISPINQRNFILSDANIGIKAHYGSTLYLERNGNARVRLENNNIGVFLTSGSKAQSPNFSSFSGVDFRNTRTLFPPLQNFVGETALQAHDRGQLIMARSADCTFDGFKYGINAFNCTIKQNNKSVTFTDIYDVNPVPKSPGTPTAISLWRSTYSPTNSGVGGAFSNPINILGADRGVYMDNSSASFYDINIGNSPITARKTKTGIEEVNGGSRTLLISKGNITTDGTGVSMNNNTLGSYTLNGVNISAGNNTASNAPNAVYGVYINQSVNTDSPKYTIDGTISATANSTISLQKGVAAIYASGIQAGTGGSNLIIREQKVKFQNVTAANAIQLSNIVGAILNRNNIAGFSNDYLTLPSNKKTAAIYSFGVSNAAYTCNTTTNTTNGISLYAGHSGSQLQTNHIQTHATGLLYGTTVSNLLPAQAKDAGNLFEGVYNAGNKSAWNQTTNSVQTGYTGQLFYNEGAGGNVLSHPLDASQFIGAPGVEFSPQGGWIKQAFDALQSCTGLAFAPAPPSSIAQQYAIAKGSTETIEFSDEMRWEAQKDWYEKVSNDPALLAAHTEWQPLKDSLATTAIADIVSLKTDAANSLKVADAISLQKESLAQSLSTITANITAAIDNGDEAVAEVWKQQYDATATALAVLDSTTDQQIKNAADNLAVLNTTMQAVELQEVNQKAVNNLYFRHFAKGEAATRSNEISLLQYIAAQCPYTGGTAVFEARGLLALLGLDQYYADANICMAQGVNLRKKSPKKVSVNLDRFVLLTPNPASSTVVLSSSTDVVGDYYTVIDLTGKIVLRDKVSATQQTIDISGLHAGLYYLKVAGIDAPTKLIVIK